MEKYICFYTFRPFWTKDKPDFTALTMNPALFTETFSERTIEFENKHAYLAFCKDGLIITKIKELESRRDEYKSADTKNEPIPPEIQFKAEYLNYINAIQVILSSALLKVGKFDYFKNSIIRSDEVFTMGFDGKEFSSSGIPGNLARTFYEGRHLSFYSNSYPVEFDHRIASRHAISHDVFTACFSDLNIVIQNTEAIHMLNQLNSALSEYQNLNFRQALVQSWFIIEYYINKKWITYLQSKQLASTESKKRIDRTRRDFLIGRDLTSSIISNILELNDLISYDIFDKINTVRNKRNVAVHNLDLIEKLADTMKENPGVKKDKRISTDDCRDAFVIIADFLKSEYQLTISLSVGYSYSPL